MKFRISCFLSSDMKSLLQQVRCRNQQQTMKYLYDDIFRVAMDFNTKVREMVTCWSEKMAVKPIIVPNCRFLVRFKYFISFLSYFSR